MACPRLIRSILEVVMSASRQVGVPHDLLPSAGQVDELKESQVPERIDFDVSVQPASLDHYRRNWTPGAGVELAGMWIGAVVSDASGQDFWGLRGADDFIVGMTHV